MTNEQFLKNQKESILDKAKWQGYCLNYKQAHDHDKNYMSISKQVAKLIDSIASKKVTNKDIDDLKNFGEYMLKNENDIKWLKDCDGLEFKQYICKIYDKTQSIGVVTERTDTTITRKIDFKKASGVSVLRNFMLLMFSKFGVEQRPPKKEKAKKTIKK